MTNGDRSPELSRHCSLVVDAFLKGRVVPFLGAGVNLCDRPRNMAWNATDANYLPSGLELAGHLADQFHYPVRQAALSGGPRFSLGLGPRERGQHGKSVGRREPQRNC